VVHPLERLDLPPEGLRQRLLRQAPPLVSLSPLLAPLPKVCVSRRVTDSDGGVSGDVPLRGGARGRHAPERLSHGVVGGRLGAGQGGRRGGGRRAVCGAAAAVAGHVLVVVGGGVGELEVLQYALLRVAREQRQLHLFTESHLHLEVRR